MWSADGLMMGRYRCEMIGIRVIIFHNLSLHHSALPTTQFYHTYTTSPSWTSPPQLFSTSSRLNNLNDFNNSPIFNNIPTANNTLKATTYFNNPPQQLPSTIPINNSYQHVSMPRQPTQQQHPRSHIVSHHHNYALNITPFTTIPA